MFGKVKIRRADQLFSKYLRAKRGYHCEYCGMFKPEGKGLQVSHFHSRRKESVRFDETNTDVLCVSCHWFFEAHKTEYAAWKLERMGEVEFNKLMLRANQHQKRDDKLVLLWLSQQEQQSRKTVASSE